MHSFHRSRGRILFEVLCALAISASLVGAWMQTGATAMLAAAAVAALYGLWHLTDLAAPKAQAVLRQVDEPVVEDRIAPSEEPVAVVIPELAPAEIVEEAIVAEPAPAAETVAAEPPPRRKSPAKRAKKAPAKRASRAAAAPEDAKVIDSTPAEAPAAELDPPTPPQDDAIEVAFPEAAEEAAQPHIAPLFEPEPFVRMQRQGFGRRGQI